MGCSKHDMSTRVVLHEKIFVIFLHPQLSTMATSTQRILSSVPKVAIMELGSTVIHQCQVTLTINIAIKMKQIPTMTAKGIM